MAIRLPDIHAYLEVRPEVAAALQNGAPVVALESTIISHGLPYPTNLETARRVEQAVRENGATPATILLRDGHIIVGATEEDLVHLAQADDVAKVSRRDLAAVLAGKRWGATTVAGTMICAALAGIYFFATGGIGGVHRGAQSSFDISADLHELASTPVMVICAGAKSILDIGLTLEYLETQGVPVLGYGTNDFPNFYTRTSGFQVNYRCDTPAEVAQIARIQWRLGMYGMLLACPIPEHAEAEGSLIEAATVEALHAAETQGIHGAHVTPFVLSQVAQRTGGASVNANIALVTNNAAITAQVAVAYAGQSNTPFSYRL